MVQINLFNPKPFFFFLKWLYSLHNAFYPYTQILGEKEGNPLLECTDKQ